MVLSNIDVIIPAAGLGKRMKIYGPKALAPIGRESIIERQIRLISDIYPSSNIVVVGGYRIDLLRRRLPRNVTLLENRNYSSTNVSRSIQIGLCYTKPTTASMIVYGDLVFNKEAISSFGNESSIVIDTKGTGREKEVGATVVDGFITRLSYGLPLKWAHICLLMPDEKQLFIEKCRQPFKRMYFGYEILNDIIESGRKFRAIYPTKMQLVEVDSNKDLERAKKVVNKRYANSL